MKNIQRIKLDDNFRAGRQEMKFVTASKWQRTDWPVDAAVIVGICSAAAMIVLFYLAF